MAASLIRLHFHDCFVQGYDVSILLHGTSTIRSEMEAGPNRNSARGHQVIDAAKLEVEKICPGVISCADILSVAARDASVAVSIYFICLYIYIYMEPFTSSKMLQSLAPPHHHVGGPSWTVKLGRRDSTTANPDKANSDLPSFRDGVNRLISRFADKGLSARDMVALSGSHTIGQAQCVTFRDRIYNNASDIDAGFASTRRRGCPANQGDGNSNLALLDLVTPNQLDNNYFKNLIQKKGLLESDQVLFSGGSTDSIVSEYSSNPSKFLFDFASAMVKMGDIEPLTGSAGQIRRIYSAVN
ncbi:hypothetical protein FEM48_Zijuj10G0163300 [Ziziphus jujuba var. spinosa]|uniref:Peroxidase n=1 Tax=Ziziphus jujuba var. spinosa TaxID=714518 RepID=A0A978UPF2_ZIZJJ|nr:hypothetical protein FEM48_Zijuj10G0163300 [Ziziphus jujuba var. spinosa]